MSAATAMPSHMLARVHRPLLPLVLCVCTLLPYYLLTYLLHRAESFLRS